MKLRFLYILIALLPFMAIGQSKHNLTVQDFDQINLGYPGLEKVRNLVENKKYEAAAKELLSYYRSRDKIKHPEYNITDRARYYGKPLSKDNQEKADKGLEHLFYVHKGYGYFDYGEDINWQYWPVKDNEVRWQLHRTYWWIPMGLAYWSSNDEKYAKEWTFQYLDWIRKNPLGLSKENDRFAWRPLEVANRVQDQTALFNMFIQSPSFTPSFLMAFLSNYGKHANYIDNNYSEKGNHLLFEAQRIIYAGAFFPEFKNAPEWRKSGIDILNVEIKKQIYPDGMQFELSPNYHTAAINIFLKAFHMAQLANIEREFPASYKQTIENMIMAQVNFSFPDYTFPMFGDAWITKKEPSINNFKEWLKVFPDNKVIAYYASDGKKGETLPFLSHALKDGGFYTFRNSWKDTATVMIVKASPPAFWHSQPDNGTFDIWAKGRNFMPDGGVFVYGGDEEILNLRNWYRQTRVHKTLTLDNRDLDSCDAKLIHWSNNDNLDILAYKNPSYSNLEHQRVFLFVNKKYFVVLDNVQGNAQGKVGIHFQLAEDNIPLIDLKAHTIYTTYKDGNNLFIQNFDTQKSKMMEEEGKVSYFYREESNRPAFVFEQNRKNEQPVSFTTVLYPFTGQVPPHIVVEHGINHDLLKGKLDLSISINGERTNVKKTF